MAGGGRESPVFPRRRENGSAPAHRWRTALTAEGATKPGWVRLGAHLDGPGDPSRALGMSPGRWDGRVSGEAGGRGSTRGLPRTRPWLRSAAALLGPFSRTRARRPAGGCCLSLRLITRTLSLCTHTCGTRTVMCRGTGGGTGCVVRGQSRESGRKRKRGDAEERDAERVPAFLFCVWRAQRVRVWKECDYEPWASGASAVRARGGACRKNGKEK